MILILFHIAAWLIYTSAIYYDLSYVAIPTAKSFIGRLQYLTFWDLNVQMLYFAFCAFIDILQIISSRECPRVKQLSAIRDFIFNTIAFPLASLVCLVFWGLYIYDRELIFPRALDAIFPSWLNHIMHTAIIITAFIEVSLFPHKQPRRKTALAALTFFISLYGLEIFGLAYLSGLWPYPILNVIGWFGKTVFFAGSVLFLLSIQLGTESINRTIWGRKVDEVDGRKKKS